MQRPLLIVMSLACCLTFGLMATSADAQPMSPRDQAIAQHVAQGRFDLAIPLAQKSVDEAKKTFGDRDVRTAIALHHLATFYLQVNQPAKALPLFKEALDINAAAGNKPGIVAERSDLGFTYAMLGDFSRAAAQFKAAKEVARATFGDTHPAYAQVLEKEARGLTFAGRLGEAEERYAQALQILTAKLGPSHPGLVNQLPRLRRLVLGNTSVEDLGGSFHAGGHIQELNLQDNHDPIAVKALLAQVHSLKLLNLGCCVLGEVPLEILNITGLDTLDMDFNALSELPAGLGVMPSLRTLRVTRNALTAESFPDTFSKTQLQSIALRGNPLAELLRRPAGLTIAPSVHLDGVDFEEPPRVDASFEEAVRQEMTTTPTPDVQKRVGILSAQLHRWTGKGLGGPSDFQAAFLRAAVAKILPSLEADTRERFQSYFDTRRHMPVQLLALRLPEEGDSRWDLTLNDGTFAGPVVTYQMLGWTIEDACLVG